MSPCRVLLPGDRPIGTRQLTILDQSQSSITCRALLGSAGREVSCDSAVQQFRIYLAKPRQKICGWKEDEILLSLAAELQLTKKEMKGLSMNVFQR